MRRGDAQRGRRLRASHAFGEGGGALSPSCFPVFPSPRWSQRVSYGPDAPLARCFGPATKRERRVRGQTPSEPPRKVLALQQPPATRSASRKGLQSFSRTSRFSNQILTFVGPFTDRSSLSRVYFLFFSSSRAPLARARARVCRTEEEEKQKRGRGERGQPRSRSRAQGNQPGDPKSSSTADLRPPPTAWHARLNVALVDKRVGRRQRRV